MSSPGKQKVLNFYAGPGVGKSTTAAGVFSLLKMRGYNVELVQEYAKELAWAGVDDIQDRELEILEQQYGRMKRLVGKVDLIITDSPLLLPIAYCHELMLRDITDLCTKWYFESFDNYDFVLVRNKPYNPKGRFQTESEAVDMDAVITDIVEQAGNPNGFWRFTPPWNAEALDGWADSVERLCGLHDCVRH